MMTRIVILCSLLLALLLEAGAQPDSASAVNYRKYRHELALDVKGLVPLTVVYAFPGNDVWSYGWNSASTTLLYRWRDLNRSGNRFRAPNTARFWRLQASFSGSLAWSQEDEIVLGGQPLEPFYREPRRGSLAVSIGQEFRKYAGRLAGSIGADAGANLSYRREQSRSFLAVRNPQTGQGFNLEMLPGMQYRYAGLSLTPFIGVRYFVNPRLSFAAEASASFSVYYDQQRGSYQDGPETREWASQSLGLNTGVSFLRYLSAGVHF
jgi:hypothetical protein